MIKKILILIIVIFSSIIPKIRVISGVYNRPDLIEIQHKCFKKFLKDDFEQFIFNDAIDAKFEKEIEQICAKLNINCIRVPQDIVHKNSQYSVPSFGSSFDFDNQPHYRVNFREGEMLQFAFEQVGFGHDDIVVSLDIDIFPLKSFSFRNILDKNQMCGTLWLVPPFISHYTMPEIMIFDMPNLPKQKAMNFNSGFIGSKWIDLCGFLQFYIFCNDIKLKFIGQSLPLREIIKSSDWELIQNGYSYEQVAFFRRYQAKMYDELGYNSALDQFQIIAKCFLNYCQCTNWTNLDGEFVENKTKLIIEFLQEITK